MTAHDHATFVEGCYRCDLSRAETPSYFTSSYRCPAIHPVEGVRCEKYADSRHGISHRVAGYWTGGDALRWAVSSA